MKHLFTLALILAVFSSAHTQQISNSSFEEWDIEGISHTPKGWTSSNNFSVPIGPAGVQKDSAAFDGSLSAKISTTLIGFAAQPYAGFIVNGQMKVSGHFDIDSIHKAGEPFVGRPKALKGFYKYSSTAMIEDWGHAFVLLKKYNEEKQKVDTIGFGSNTLLNPSDNYREFIVPINYYNEDVEPDSIVVAFFSTYPTSPLEGAHLWIDHISLDYSSGIDDPALPDDIHLFPNPASTQLRIEGPIPKDITVINISGQEVLHLSRINSINIETLQVGLYFIILEYADQKVVKRFVKQDH